MNINTRCKAETTSFATMAQTVQKIVPLLKRLQRMTPGERKKYIKSCSKKFILDLCECSRNILKGNVPLKSAHLNCLKRYKQSLRALSLKATSLTARKKILQKGGFLTALLPSLIPGLVSLISGLFRSNGKH